MREYLFRLAIALRVYVTYYFRHIQIIPPSEWPNWVDYDIRNNRQWQIELDSHAAFDDVNLLRDFCRDGGFCFMQVDARFLDRPKWNELNEWFSDSIDFSLSELSVSRVAASATCLIRATQVTMWLIIYYETLSPQYIAHTHTSSCTLSHLAQHWREEESIRHVNLRAHVKPEKWLC